MAQQLKSEVSIEAPALPASVKKSLPKSSLLKTLREKKNLSRNQVANRTHFSVYQVEGLEGQGTENVLNRFLTYTTALGYKTDDILKLILQASQGSDPTHLKGTIGKALFEKTFEDGVKLHTYLEKDGIFLGLLELSMGHSIYLKQIHAGDLVLGIIREGILTVDFLTSQAIHKKDSFFVLPGSVPARFLNEDGLLRTASILLFSAKFPI